MSVNVGVIGLGSIGLRHAGNLLAAGAAVRGFDPAPERRARLAEIGGAPLDSRDAAMDGVDAVAVASPSGCHLDDMSAAIGAAKHVFVEKPLAHSADGLPAALEEADAKGLCVVAGLNLRFHPAVKAARTLLAKGAVGEPLWGRLLAASYLPDWRPGEDYRTGYAADPRTGGVLFDFIHEFDMAVHLLGSADTVAASARRSGRLDLESEDCADIVLRHGDGVQSAIHVDYVTRPRRRETEITGTEGILRLDLEAGRLMLTDPDGAIVEDKSFAIDPNAMYVDEMNAFLDCVRDGAAPACSGWEGLEVLKLVIRARELCGLPVS
jgi:predicted dehydrogenase